MKILIIEDEVNLAKSIQEILKQNAIQSDIIHDGQEGLDYALYESYDCILLDVMLPSLNGFEVVKQLRANHSQVPVLFLTAKTALENKITGLTVGGDDYLTKPFASEELLARIFALTRRVNQQYGQEIIIDNLKLDLTAHQLIGPTQSISLSSTEFDLLKFFFHHPHQILSKEQIINNVWGSDSDVLENNVEAYISFLRKKLAFLNSSVCIKTLRSIGYQLEVNHD